MQGVPHALLLALSALAAPVVAPGLGVQEADGPKKIAMVWDCDNTVGLRLPRGILNNQRPVGGDKNGGPGTGHGLAVNIYSGGVFPGVNSPWAIPQLGNCFGACGVAEALLAHAHSRSSVQGRLLD